MIADTEKMCSIVPLMPVKKPFWRLALMILFSRTNRSSCRAMILWYSWPTTDVRVMGQKFAGKWSSPFLKTNLHVFLPHTISQGLSVYTEGSLKRGLLGSDWWMASSLSGGM